MPLQLSTMSLPLFPDPETIRREEYLRDTFHAWVAYRAQSNSPARSERALREGSAKVYQEMWHAFAAYCATRNLALDDIRAGDIQAFLSARSAAGPDEALRMTIKGEDLSPRYVWRMLTLIDRVLQFHARRVGIVPNQAAHELLRRPEYRYANATHKDPLPEYYGEDQAKQLINHLTQIGDEGLAAGRISWKELRDRTAVSLMLGGGLAPGDVRVLALNGVISEDGRDASLPWKLVLPGNGNSPARETPLAEWAGRQLAFWLSVRSEHKIAGDLVFPSTLGGKPWSHTACYEACKAVLAGAGMESDSGGVFKLRHTFALRQLANGKGEAEVAQWLGLVDINSMARYRRIVLRQVDVA